MLDTRPWGFDAEFGLLGPGKVVTDPVHGDIHLTRLETLVVDTRPFQRLRKVRQLGMTAQVYPGATNTRFAHSLGSVRAAQMLLDVVLEQRFDPHGHRDLFSQWDERADDEDEFARKVGEVVALARLGALLHDLCHIPYGHSVEDDLGILEAHDANEARFSHLWAELVSDVKEAVEPRPAAALESFFSGRLYRNLRPLILSKGAEDGGDLEYRFVQDIVGNTICADLIDYLPRDHLYAGLPMALGHRFLSAFFVTTDDRTRKAERMALSIVRDDRERTDVVTELLKYLRYRYELTERLLVHHAKLAADAMVGKALELWFDQLEEDIKESDGVASDAPSGEEQDPGAHGSRAAPAGDAGVRAAETVGSGSHLRAVSAERPTSAERQRRTPSDDAAPGTKAELVDLEERPGDSPRVRAQKRVERRILRHGDDGLLEHLGAWAQERLEAGARSSRLTALAHLVESLERRDLFRLQGRSSTQHASAVDIYQDHGSPARRRELEEDAARFAGIDEPWKIAIWLPPPAPRLKSAAVLTFDGSEVVEFHKLERYADKRGEEIYSAHERLWGVSCYMHRSIHDDRARRALVRLAQVMEVRWDREIESLGRQVFWWPDILAARDAAGRVELAGHRDRELVRMASEQKVARGPREVATFEDLVALYEPLAESLKRAQT